MDEMLNELEAESVDPDGANWLLVNTDLSKMFLPLDGDMALKLAESRGVLALAGVDFLDDILSFSFFFSRFDLFVFLFEF